MLAQITTSADAAGYRQLLDFAETQLPGRRCWAVAGLRFHDLRHTSATLSVTARASTRELMARMGHSSPPPPCVTSTSWRAGTPPSRPPWTS